jgi:adenine-specific DNA glycosylase
MDFGSLVCKKSGVKVDICPLAKKGLYAGGPVINAPKVSKKEKKEPGRLVGSTFVPNRIFRGRVIEQLRLSSGGLTLEQLGARISVDWSPREHREWLQGIVEKLALDQLLMKSGKTYRLPR